MQDKIDIFIPASPKDQLKLKYCIEQAVKHIPQCGDFVVSVPDKDKFWDYEVGEHKVMFFNDFDLLPVVNWLKSCRFRPNWILQQMLKLLQPATRDDFYFCLDADCFICRDMSLLEDKVPRVFVSANGNDEAAFHRFIAKMTGGELCKWTDCNKTSTKYIADMQLFSRSQIQELVLRYFPSGNDFVHFIVDNTYWRTDDTQHSIFVSEYELYGLWMEKMHPRDFYTHCIQKRQIDRNQMSQQDSKWTEDEIVEEIKKAEADGIEILKLQSNSPMHDVGWKLPASK